MTKFKDMSYDDLIFMQKKIKSHLAKRAEAKVSDVTTGMTALVDWHSPIKYRTYSVQDIIDSLNRIEDKTLPVSFREFSEEGNSNPSRWGMLNRLLLVTVDEGAVSHGDSPFYDCNQLVIDISEMG